MTARRPRRRLAGDLVQATGLSLGEFDVLAQLAVAGGELRMSELAGRALSSRSGMTRRVTRLVEESLVTRTTDDADARGVVVALTEAGIARLAEAAPVHLRDVVELFARSSATRSSISSRARSTRSLSSAHSVPEETGPGSATRIRGAPANP
jgi:DNA-binding MarR family transcriptional regulator